MTDEYKTIKIKKEDYKKIKIESAKREMKIIDFIHYLLKELNEREKKDEVKNISKKI